MMPDRVVNGTSNKDADSKPRRKRRKKRKAAKGPSSNWASLKGTIAPESRHAKALRAKRRRVDHSKQSFKTEREQRNAGKSHLPTPTSTTASGELYERIQALPTFKGQEKVFALDCEMVGVGHDDRSILARCTIVNGHGEVVFDKHVRPMRGQEVTNYRTHVSGIRPKDIKYNPNAITFSTAQREVAAIIDKHIVVGHSLKNDFHALMLTHPPHLVRDTARYKPLLRARKQGSFKVKHRPQKLKKLTSELIGVEIQKGEHDSGDDARAALLLYYKFRKEWEGTMRKRYRQNR